MDSESSGWTSQSGVRVGQEGEQQSRSRSGVQSVWGQPTAACSFRSFRWDDFSRSRDNHHSRHLSLPSFSSFIIHGWAASDIMSETCKACQTCPRFCSSRGPGAFCPGQAGEELPLPFKLKGRREAVASRKSARVEGRARLAPARHRVLGGFSLAGAGGGGGGGGGECRPPRHTRARGSAASAGPAADACGRIPRPAPGRMGPSIRASLDSNTIPSPSPRRCTACTSGVGGGGGGGGSVTSLPSRCALRGGTRANALGEGGEWGLDGKGMKWMKSCTSATVVCKPSSPGRSRRPRRKLGTV